MSLRLSIPSLAALAVIFTCAAWQAAAVPLFDDVASADGPRLLAEAQALAAATDAAPADVAFAYRRAARALQLASNVPGFLSASLAAYERFNSVYGPRDGRSALAAVHYATALFDSGDEAASQKLLMPVHERAQRNEFGDESARVLTASAGLLGYAHFVSGRPQKALPYMQTAYEQAMRAFGAGDVETSTRQKNLMMTQFALGRAAEALELASALVTEAEQRFGESHVETQNRRYILAAIQLDLGLLNRARETNLRGVEAIAKNPAARRQQGAAVWQLARICEDARDLVCAEDAYRRALQMQSEALGPQHPDTRSIRVGLAGVLAGRGDLDQAAAEAQNTLDLARERDGNDVTLHALRAQRVLADVARARGNRVEQRSRLEQFVRDAERYRQRAWLVPEQETVRFSRLVPAYRQLSRLYAEEGEAIKAFAIAELAKARALTDIRQEQDRLRQQLSGEQAVRFRMLALELAKATAELEGATTAAERTRWRLDRERLTRDMGMLIPQAADGAALEEPSALVERARRSLLPGERYVSLVAFDDRVLAFTLERHTPLKHVWLETPALADTVASWRALLSTPPGEQPPPVWRDQSGALNVGVVKRSSDARALAGGEALVAAGMGGRLMAPLMGARAPAAWLISPDGPLHSLSFDALRVRGKRLIETATVRIIPSIHWLAQRASAPTVPLGRVLAVRPDRVPGQAPLAGARREARAIESLFGKRVTLLDGSQASRSQLATLSAVGTLREFSWIHVASHAQYDALDPWRSGVVLEEGGRATRFTAREMQTLDLAADLVVLAACDSGRGGVLAGEGVVGIPFALAGAGAKRTVLAHWAVADESTSRLMQRFYGELARRKAPHEALARAKRQLLADSRTRHPFHWAAFSQVGR